jgi:hypothetical protein
MTMRAGFLLCSLWILAWAPGAQAAPLVFDDIVIEGEVQKPEIAVFISRQNLNKQYELAPLRESFLPRIIEALDKPPF